MLTTITHTAERILDGTLRCETCRRDTEIRGGIWMAMGPHRAVRTLAQLSNVVPPTPQLYERLWRVRSLSLLSGRSFPVAEELAELTAALAPGPGRRCVDVACSEGLYARRLAASGAAVAAVDHSEPFLRRLAARTLAEELRIAPIQALAQNLPLASGAFDGVAMGGSLNEIGDAPVAVAEMARVLAPGGRSFSMHLVAASSRPGRALQAVLRLAGIAFPTLAASREMFAAAGLEVTDARTDRVVVRMAGRRT